jgi:hypothetical protein
MKGVIQEEDGQYEGQGKQMIASGEKKTDGCERKQQWPVLKYCPRIFLEGIQKVTKKVRCGCQTEDVPDRKKVFVT